MVEDRSADLSISGSDFVGIDSRCTPRSHNLIQTLIDWQNLATLLGAVNLDVEDMSLLLSYIARAMVCLIPTQ